MWNAEYLVLLWLLPVVLQILLPLLIFCFWFFIIYPVQQFFFENVPVDEIEPVHTN